LTEEKKIVGKIEKIPEGSRFEKYVKEIVLIIGGIVNADKLETFLTQVFQDCCKFITKSGLAVSTVHLILVYKNDQYLELERQFTQRAINLEVAIAPTTAFIITRGLTKTIYVNVARLIEVLPSGYPSFILNLVDTYMHEIIHDTGMALSEQETYDLSIKMDENFLGIELPKQFKELKSSDYYAKKE
jgi:hypothetical protein